jgi:hypothetical protein
MRKPIIMEYILAVFRWWWVMLVFTIGDIAGIILTVWNKLQVHFWLWIVIFLVGLSVAQFLAFNDLRKKSDAIQAKLNTIINAKPRLVLRSIEHRKDIAKAIKEGEKVTVIGTPEFSRIWIANEPLLPKEGVDAELLHGEIEYYKQGSETPLFTMGGRWPEQGQPAGSLLTQQLTVPPNRKAFCMDIGMKYPEDDEYYGYDDEAHLRPDGRNPRTKLGKGIYSVKVILACKGLIQPHYFRLKNLGSGHDINFEQISESDFHKGDCQT